LLREVIAMNSPYGEELESFRHTVRTFFARELAPRLQQFEEHGLDRQFWLAAGRAGILGSQVPEEYGGAGAGPLPAMIISEELGRSPAAGATGSSLNSDVLTGVLTEYGTREQCANWFPGILSGELTQALAVTEPQAGSDVSLLRTSAVRRGGEYVINGSKCFITNGAKSDLIYVVARTSATDQRALTVLAVPGSAPGVTRRRTRVAGFKACDTGEIFFDEVQVPVTSRIGEEGQALRIFRSVMAHDRLQIAARSLAAAHAAFDLTLDYAQERRMFGQRLVDLQNTQFVLAGVETELAVGDAFRASLIQKIRSDTFDAADGAMAKIWLPEMESRAMDACLQLWGGTGMMDESPIARLHAACRVQRIYAGATELMKSQLAKRYLY
jgi:acyl-CoA dehydrogenase